MPTNVASTPRCVLAALERIPEIKAKELPEGNASERIRAAVRECHYRKMRTEAQVIHMLWKTGAFK